MLFFMISLLTYFTYLLFKGMKYLSYFKKQKYDLKKIKPFILKEYLNIELLGIIIVVLTFFLYSKVIGIIFIIFYAVLSLIEIRKASIYPKLNRTSITTILITLIIYAIVFVIIFIDYYDYQKGFIFYDRTNYYYIIVFVLGYIEYLILYFSLKLSKKLKNKASKK